MTAGASLRCIVWNIQYGASVEREFFYDGGEAVSTPDHVVVRTLASIAGFIDEQAADLALLQEIDRGSRRTGLRDEHHDLRPLFACGVTTPYHRVRYVPHPPHEHLGRVDMHLGTYSQHGLRDPRRHPLARMDEPLLRRAFNLRRAVLETRLPIDDGRELVVFNTHLSAFSRGDGTVGRQVAQLVEILQATDEAGHPWLLAGDFNALPPGDRAERLSRDQDQYPEQHSPLTPLFERFATPVEPRQLVADIRRHGTYVPFGAQHPDRTLDYVFYGGGLQVDDLEVLDPKPRPSDHRPIRFTCTIPTR